MESIKFVPMYEWDYAVNNQQPGIVRHIRDASFPNLQYIGLGENRLQSIEALVRVNVPALIELGIRKE